jgi:hypothetical protein
MRAWLADLRAKAKTDQAEHRPLQAEELKFSEDAPGNGK